LLSFAADSAAELKAKGRDVGSLEKQLSAAKARVKDARREWHTFDLKRVRKLSQDIFVQARKVRNDAKSMQKGKGQ